MHGKGDEYPGIISGDLIIIYQLKKHPRFTRDNDDLICEHKITLAEAMTGFQFKMKMLDESTVYYKPPSKQIVKDGQILKLNGYGLPV